MCPSIYSMLDFKNWHAEEEVRNIMYQIDNPRLRSQGEEGDLVEFFLRQVSTLDPLAKVKSLRLKWQNFRNVLWKMIGEARFPSMPPPIEKPHQINVGLMQITFKTLFYKMFPQLSKALSGYNHELLERFEDFYKEFREHSDVFADAINNATLKPAG